MNNVYTVDVTFATHDQVKAGNHAAHWSRVIVMADSGDDAILAACQLVATMNLGTMPTDATVCI